MPVESNSEIRASSGNSEFYEGKQVAITDGLESDREGKEVYNDEGGKHVCYISHPPAGGHDAPEVVAFSRSRKGLYLIIGVGILIIVVAASIAVGVVVSRNKK